MVKLRNGELIKEIHENMIVFKEFARNMDKRVDGLEVAFIRQNAEHTKMKINMAKTDLWSKSKTIAITILSGACGWLAKTVVS